MVPEANSPGDVSEEDGYEVRVALFVRATEPLADEEGHRAEALRELRLGEGEGEGPRGVEMVEPDAVEVVARRERRQEGSGRGGGPVHEDPRASGDEADSLGCGHRSVGRAVHRGASLPLGPWGLAWRSLVRLDARCGVTVTGDDD